jgi:hypothetical protein
MYRYSLLNLTESIPAESLYGVRATAWGIFFARN